MAYTTYPQESSEFASKANEIRTKLQENETNITNINSIFHVDTNEDYLTLKTLEANEKIANIIEEGIQALNTDVLLVQIQADKYEQAEADRQEALRRQQENTDENN